MGLLGGRCRQLAPAYAPLILARLQRLGLLSVRVSPHEQYPSCGEHRPGLSSRPQIGLREKDDGLRVGRAGPFIRAPLWPTPASRGICRMGVGEKGRALGLLLPPRHTLLFALFL